MTSTPTPFFDHPEKPSGTPSIFRDSYQDIEIFVNRNRQYEYRIEGLLQYMMKATRAIVNKDCDGAFKIITEGIDLFS